MRKPVYNERYYKIQALLKNEDFQNDIKLLKDHFAKYGVPVPDGGFGKYNKYLEWNERFWDVWSERNRSYEVKALWKKYADPKDNKIHGTDNYDAYEHEKDNLVPPVYGAYLRDVATKYGFGLKDEDLHEFLIHHIFLGKTEITDPSFVVNHRRNDKTGESEMYVRIFPWTTKQDIVDGWNFIKDEQKWYRKGQNRNQEWKSFNRDYRIFELYEQAREKQAQGDERRLEEITYALYYAETKDEEMDYDNIKRIAHQTRKRLGLSDELPSDNS